MTTTSAKPSSRSGVDAVKSQLSSVSTCSAATVASLQELLGAAPKSTTATSEKENVRSKPGRTVVAAATTRTKTAPKARPTKTKATIAVEVIQDAQAALTPQEKFILATEVVNSSLKALSDALKPQSISPTHVVSTVSKHSQHSRAASSTPNSTSVLSSRPLLSRTVSQLSNASAKPSLGRSSSLSISKSGTAPSIVALAECARLAFAYLRTSEAWKNSGKDLPPLQVENGMLSLVGKMLAHGLETLAAKELRILRRRLEVYMDVKKEGANTPATTVAEKETVADLLHFEKLDTRSSALQLVLSHQIYVLKLISSSKRANMIESANEFLQMSSPSSPVNILSYLAERPGNKDKTARQLESIAQMLLSLCPSISGSDDSVACNPKLHATPDTIFQLQALAFEARSRWWKLSGHQGDATRELLEPFSKCLTAFARRSTAAPSEKYAVAVAKYKNLEDFVKLQSKTNSPSQSTVEANICRTLSSLAQSAALGDEALEWTQNQASSAGNSRASEAALAACRIRIATLSLEKASDDEQEETVMANLEDALQGLTGSLKGDSADLDTLLTEVTGLRRTATRTFLDAGIPKEAPEEDPADRLRGKCFFVIAACAHFLARYIGTNPGEGADAKTLLRHGERLAIASKAIKGFIDSTMVCCRNLIQSSKITWAPLDGLLQDCCFSLSELETHYKCDAQRLQQLQTSLQNPFVKVSGLYWLYYAQLRKTGASGDSILWSLRRSVETIASRSEEEKVLGFYLTKLEKLGELMETMRKYEEAAEVHTQALRSQIASGVLQDAEKQASTISLIRLLENDGSTVSVRRMLRSLHQTYLRVSQRDDAQKLFYDDEELDHPTRSWILELQLDIFLEGSLKFQHRHAAFERGLRNLVELLFQLYNAAEYPLRRQRVATVVFRLCTTRQGLFPEALILDAMACVIEPETPLGSDTGLASYQEHFAASHKACMALLEPAPSVDMLQSALMTWQRIIDSSGSWDVLLTHIDTFETWVWQLQMMSDFFDMQGLEFLRVPTLSIVAKALELQQPINVDMLVRAITILGQQYLRLGYSGKAGLALAKAQNLLGAENVSTEADLQWHLAYSEYMITLGNHEKWQANQITRKQTTLLTKISGETLRAAGNLANNDADFASMACSTSLSTRIRYNKMLSEASYVHSLYALQTGHANEALAYAKTCVSLNQKIWMAVENRNKKRTEATESPKADMDAVTTGVAHMSIQTKATPIIMTMTHEALTGAALWPYVSSIFRGLSQVSSIYAHQGMLQEAAFYADRACNIAQAVKSNAFIIQNASEMTRYYLESDRLEKAVETVTKADPFAKRLHNSTELARYLSVSGRLHQLQDEQDDALQKYDQAQNIIHGLIDSIFIQKMDKLNREEEELASKMSQVKLEVHPSRTRKTPAKKPAATKKVAAKPATKKTAQKSAVATAPATESSTAAECPPLESIQGDILCRKADLLLSSEKLSEAIELITQAENLKLAQNSAIQHQSTRFRSLMSEAMREIAADFTFNALPESTISFPALSRGDRRRSEQSQARPSYLFVEQSSPAAPPPPARKTGKGKKVAKEDFAAILQKARDCIAEVQNQVLHTSSTSAVKRVCSMLNEVTILLSATSPRGAKGSLHPLYAAYLTELPKATASRLEQLALSIDQQPSRDQLLAWPSLPEDQQKLAHLTPSDFQTEYVNIIPPNWSAVSLSLNEARDELYITRYVADQSPFILRLPLARHNARDMDEEIFGFEEGRQELTEIISLSVFGMRNTPDLTKKGAKTEWWAEREALDARLRDLLINIESIWLGGFRGIFAEKKGDKALLARFQKSFQNILDRHLPSRQGKGKQIATPQLDSRILELFVGLGNPDDEGKDLDEPLMDLVYFVVDILQFNGERNAYDEIDFDTIIIEMLDALRAYHTAADPASMKPQHTILILDKNLHAFPWESLPSLQSLSISRLPSMSALRERLLAARAPKPVRTFSPSSNDSDSGEPEVRGGHHIPRSALRGTGILNPAGDLKNTQETLEPHLARMPGTWDNLVGRTPDEKYFEDVLTNKDVLLYFGHGSGGQYIRGRTVRRLWCRTHPAAVADKISNSGFTDSVEEVDMDVEKAEEQPKNLAISLLFGCSSAHITENGSFEPSGMLSSYLTAGTPAVLGMLWDVTDKDCDRFAVSVLQHWGLFQPEECEPKRESRTPARGAGKMPKTPGKSRSRSRPGKKWEPEKFMEVGGRNVSLDEAVAKSRSACYLRYLNGAAGVVYGIPVFLE